MPSASDIAPRLLPWYDREGRDLPWRRTKDPYAIWVSEIMLQQTRVDTVMPYYARFMQRFPTVRDLAAADDEEVRAQWSGLGFYRRARFLHSAAKVVVDEHAGVVPRTLKDVLALPGVGRYTAGAILSFAHGRRAPILDGNVIRVLSRVFRVEGAPDRSAVQKELWALAEAVLPERRPGDFNQSLMDLGATVCTPRNPKCGPCPLADVCVTGPRGEAESFPAPTKRQKVKFVRRVALRVDAPDGRFLLVRRPVGGLLGALWTLPALSYEDRRPAEVADELAASLGADGTPRPRGRAEHRFSHRHWTTDVFRLRGSGAEAPDSEHRWAAVADLQDLGLPTAARKELGASEQAQGELFRRR